MGGDLVEMENVGIDWSFTPSEVVISVGNGSSPKIHVKLDDIRSLSCTYDPMNGVRLRAMGYDGRNLFDMEEPLDRKTMEWTQKLHAALMQIKINRHARRTET